MASMTVWQKAALGLASLLGGRQYEIPEWMAPSLAKAAQHKYIRRVLKPNGKGYRYFYTVTGGHGLGHHAEFQVGSAFRMADKGQEGHFHVTGVHDDGHLTIKHDETGTEHRLHKDALSAMLRNEHAAALTTAEKEAGEKREAAKNRALKDLSEARAAGSDKHIARAKSEALKHGASEDETLSAAEREQRQKAAEESARKRRKAPAPEEKASPPKPADDKPSSPKGEHQRVGSHVGGSRRDLAQLSRNEVAELEPDEAKRLVTKAKVYAFPTPEDAQAQGWSPGAYAIWKGLYNTIGTAPAERYPYTTEAAREDRLAYMDALDYFAKTFDSAKGSVASMKAAIQSIKDEKGLGTGGPNDYSHFMAEMRKDAEDEAAYGTRMYRTGTGKTSRIAASPTRIREAILGAKFKGALQDMAILFSWMREGDTRPPRAHGIAQTHIETLTIALKAERDGWGDGHRKDSATPVTPAKPDKPERFIFNRSVGDKPERAGGRPLTNANADDMHKEFGLHEVDFGNWVTQDDREHHLKWAHSALRDLEDVTGITPGGVALHGITKRIGRNPLALAFGARGKGKAAAHYETHARDEKTRTLTPTINLTRMAGGGTLAHEWGHFLDHMLGEAHNTGPDKGDAKFMSESNIRALPADLQGPAHALNAALRDGDYATHAEALGDYWARRHEMFARAFESYIEDKLASQGRKNSYLVEGTKPRYKTEKMLPPSRAAHEAMPGYTEAKAAMHAAENEHYRNPARDEFVRQTLLAEHAKNPRRKWDTIVRDHSYGAGDAWNTTPEGAASYSQVKAARKAVTDIESATPKQHAQPYPQGEQRQRINVAFDKLLAAIAAGKHLEKAMARLANDRAAIALATLFKAATINPWVEIPEALALAMIVKGRNHKYIKRVPTGKTTKTGRPIYRYYYKVTSGTAAAEHFQVGASFADKKIGEHGGHWHIHGKDGDKLHLRHDETGEERHVTEGELAAMLHHGHGVGEHDKAKRDKALADLKAAREGKASARTVDAAKKRALAAGADEKDTREPLRVKTKASAEPHNNSGTQKVVTDVKAKKEENPADGPAEHVEHVFVDEVGSESHTPGALYQNGKGGKIYVSLAMKSRRGHSDDEDIGMYNTVGKNVNAVTAREATTEEAARFKAWKEGRDAANEWVKANEFGTTHGADEFLKKDDALVDRQSNPHSPQGERITIKPPDKWGRKARTAIINKKAGKIYYVVQTSSYDDWSPDNIYEHPYSEELESKIRSAHDAHESDIQRHKAHSMILRPRVDVKTTAPDAKPTKIASASDLHDAISDLKGVDGVKAWSKDGKNRLYVNLAKLNGGRLWNGGVGHVAVVDLNTGSVDLDQYKDWAGAKTFDYHSKNGTLEAIRKLAQEYKETLPKRATVAVPKPAAEAATAPQAAPPASVPAQTAPNAAPSTPAIPARPVEDKEASIRAISEGLAGARKIVLRGNTFGMKDQIKRLGGKWDPDAKVWWMSHNSKKDQTAVAEMLHGLRGNGVVASFSKGGALERANAYLRNALEAAALSRALNQG